MLAVGIDDARLGSRVGIDEEAVFISVIVRAFQVAVTERCLDGFESRYSAAIALELAFAFFVGSLDGGADLFYGLRIRLGDDQADAVLRRTAIDGLRFLDVGIRPSGIDSGNHFARIDIILGHNKFLLIFHH